MSFAQGSIGFQKLDISGSPPGPPFVAASADNGLSVDPVTGKIVLGQGVGEVGDPGQLLSNREIPLKGFSFTLGEAGDLHLVVNPGAGSYQIGDISTLGNGMRFSLDDATQIARIESALELALFIAPQTYSFGNVGDTLNGTKIALDDTNDSLAFRSLAKSRMMSLQGFNDLYRIGDIDAVGNNTILAIDDSIENSGLGDYDNFLSSVVFVQGHLGGTQNPTVELFAPRADGNFSDVQAFCNPVPTFFAASDRRATTAEYMEQRMESTFFHVAHIDAGAVRRRSLFLDYVNGLYQIGDIEGLANGTKISIDDGANEVKINNTANTAIVEINGVNGFTGTVTPVTTITVDGGIVTNVA